MYTTVQKYFVFIGLLKRVFLFTASLNIKKIAVLVNDQLYAQLLDFIIRLLQSFTCFEQRRAHHQEVKLY